MGPASAGGTGSPGTIPLVYGDFYINQSPVPYDSGVTFGEGIHADHTQVGVGITAVGAPFPAVFLGYQLSVTGDYFVEYSVFMESGDTGDKGFNAIGLANGGSGPVGGSPGTVYPQSVCSINAGHYTTFATTIEANANDVVCLFNITSGGTGTGMITVGTTQMGDHGLASSCITLQLIDTP
jgi:hypothetical protein